MSVFGIWIGLLLIIVGAIMTIPAVPLTMTTGGLGLFAAGVLLLVIALGGLK